MMGLKKTKIGLFVIRITTYYKSMVLERKAISIILTIGSSQTKESNFKKYDHFLLLKYSPHLKTFFCLNHLIF